MSDVVYVDTSAVLRAVLERGVSPGVEQNSAPRAMGEVELLTTDERLAQAAASV